MASYTRLGSFLSADDLADLPYGRVHRALTIAGRAFERHHLLFTFSDELAAAGLGARLPEAQKVAVQLSGTRGFGSGYRFESARPAHMACEYLPGRTLAQVLAKAREEQVPLGVEHALMVLQGLAQAVIQMHDKGFHHGALSTHSAWVSFEGATQILDAPLGALFQSLLPKAPAMKAALEPYRCPTPASPFQQDLFSLGAVLYEMLTLDRLAAGSAIPGALAQATLKAAQEDAPIPEEILNFLKRLLMVGQPFGSAPEFNATLERVLYDGEYSPTTFNMAFLMHTLFREENEADALAMKNDQVTDFGPYAPQEAAQASPKAARSTNLPIYLLLGGIVVVLAAGIGGGVLWVQSINRQHQIEQRSMQARLAAIQRDKEAADAKLAEINKQEEAQKTLEELFGKQAEEATSSEARAAAKRDLEAAKQKRADLAKQRADALKEKQRLAQAGGGEEGSGLDVEPAVTQVGSPRVPNRASLPPSLQQSEVKVVLKVFVDAGGKPQKVVIVKGVEGNYGFNDSAQNAALASSFTPGRKNGKPAPGWLDMEINFGRPQ